MDMIGIQRQRGYTTRLATNITLNLMRGKTIVCIVNTAAHKNTLVVRVYAILAALQCSSSLVPVTAGSYYRFTNGGTLQVIMESDLKSTATLAPLLNGRNQIECLCSEPGRLTMLERNVISPYCSNKMVFLDEHNIPVTHNLGTNITQGNDGSDDSSMNDKKVIKSR